MPKIKVIYHCWGCGSEETKIEDIELRVPVGVIEIWNVCPECIEKRKKVPD